MMEIPRLYRGKNHGEEWYIQGLKDACAGMPMRTEQGVKDHPGNLPRSLVWNAYKAGYEVGLQMENGDRYFADCGKR